MPAGEPEGVEGHGGTPEEAFADARATVGTVRIAPGRSVARDRITEAISLGLPRS